MSGERSLPKGWIVKQSTSYPDKVYYFNVETGVSAWERPDLLTSPTDDLPPFDFKNDPRVKDLEKKVFERLSKTATPIKRQDNKSKAAKSYNVPTAVVSPFSNKKCTVPNHDPRLYRQITPSTSGSVESVCRNALVSMSETPQNRKISVEDKNFFNCGVNLDFSATETFQNRSFSVDGMNLSSYCENDDESETEDLFSSSEENEDSFLSSEENIDLFLSSVKNQDSFLSSRENQESFLSSAKNQDSFLSSEENPESFLSLDEIQGFSNHDRNISMAFPSLVQNKYAKDDKSIKCCFVPDTNVFLGNLDILKKIFHSSTGGKNSPHFFIPRVVTREMDDMVLQFPNDYKLCSMTKKCKKFINNMVTRKVPKFHYQSVGEINDSSKGYEECNDDGLIEYCLSLRKKMPLAEVILVSNDLSLNIKAHIFNIPLISVEDLVSKLGLKCEFSPTSPKSCVNFPKSTKICTSVTKSSKTPNIDEKEMLKNRKWSSVRLSLPGKTIKKKEKPQIISEAFLELKNVLHPFLVGELHQVYGDNWKSLNINLSNMKSILSFIVQHWESIFASSYSKKIQRNFMLLKTNFNGSDYSQFSEDDYLNTLTAIEDIFCNIKRKYPTMDINIENIQDMRLAIVELLKDNVVFHGAPVNNIDDSFMDDCDSAYSQGSF